MPAPRTHLCIAVLFATLLAPLHAADPALLNLARPDSNVIIGIDVAGFASSPLIQEAMATATSSSDDFQKVMGLLGPNPFQNLQEILIAAKVDDFNQEPKPGNFLMAARGSFGGTDFTQHLCSNGCETVDYRDLQMLKFSPKNGEEDVFFAALDSQYAAMGHQDAVRQAVDRRATQSHSVFDSALQNSITRLSRHHFWLAARGPFQKALGDNPMMPPGTVGKVDGMGFGLRFSSGVDLALELLSFTDQDAKQLYDMANGFLALMQAGDTPPEAAELLNSLSLRLDGPVLSASLRISEAQIRAQMAKQGATMSGSGVTAAEPLPSTGSYSSSPTVAPKPRRSGGIRIFGLEEEPVEVPTQDR
jgi:hypothetical protein